MATVNSNDGSARALRKGPWTSEEDEILIAYVRKNGAGNWNLVEEYSGLRRCAKSCRLRWMNSLRPGLKKGPFTAQEEAIVVYLQSTMGNQWAKMTSQLPGRSDNEIKNFWNARKKKRVRGGLPLYHEIEQQPDQPPFIPINESQSIGNMGNFHNFNQNNSFFAQNNYSSEASEFIGNLETSFNNFDQSFLIPSSSSANINPLITYNNVNVNATDGLMEDFNPGQENDNYLWDYHLGGEGHNSQSFYGGENIMQGSTSFHSSAEFLATSSMKTPVDFNFTNTIDNFPMTGGSGYGGGGGSGSGGSGSGGGFEGGSGSGGNDGSGGSCGGSGGGGSGSGGNSSGGNGSSRGGPMPNGYNAAGLMLDGSSLISFNGDQRKILNLQEILNPSVEMNTPETFMDDFSGLESLNIFDDFAGSGSLNIFDDFGED